MIRKACDLEARLCTGSTVSLVGNWDGPGFRLVDTETNETVFWSALKRLDQSGKVAVVATDICGEPMQWRLAN